MNHCPCASWICIKKKQTMDFALWYSFWIKSISWGIFPQGSSSGCSFLPRHCCYKWTVPLPKLYECCQHKWSLKNDLRSWIEYILMKSRSSEIISTLVFSPYFCCHCQRGGLAAFPYYHIGTWAWLLPPEAGDLF